MIRALDPRPWRFLPLALSALAAVASGWALKSSVQLLCEPQRPLCGLALGGQNPNGMIWHVGEFLQSVTATVYMT